MIAHRGASGSAPENTMLALKLALERGADALEIDVRVTADGEAVLVHDPTTTRTGDRGLPVATSRWQELSSVDVGHGIRRSGAWNGPSQPIPRLVEVLEELPSVPLLVEIKEPGDAARVLEILSAAPHSRERIVVGSFSHAAVAALAHGGFALSASRRQTALFAATLNARWCGRPRFQVLSIPPAWHGLPLASTRVVRAAERQGIPVHVWTVNEEVSARALWRRGVTGIITDFPGIMAAVRSEVGRGV